MNNFSNEGMATHFDQEKDRQNWEKSIAERKEIIQALKKAGVCPKHPEQIKMKTLKNLLISIQ